MQLSGRGTRVLVMYELVSRLTLWIPKQFVHKADDKYEGQDLRFSSHILSCFVGTDLG